MVYFYTRLMYFKRTFAIIAAIAALSAGFTGCNSKKGDASQSENSALEVDAVLASADSLMGKEVTLQGVCTHVCPHGAKKIFLMGSDDTQTIRIEAGDFGAFSKDCVNKLVTVTGTLAEQRIDEAFLADWEARITAKDGCAKQGKEEGCSSEHKACNKNCEKKGEKGCCTSEQKACNGSCEKQCKKGCCASEQKACNGSCEKHGKEGACASEHKACNKSCAKHGKEEGCSSEHKAHDKSHNNAAERIANFRQRIAEQQANNGKDYLSFYYIEATAYEIEG